MTSVLIFIRNFYRVKLNKDGNVLKADRLPILLYRRIKDKLAGYNDSENLFLEKDMPIGIAVAGAIDQRRIVLIATIEYDI